MGEAGIEKECNQCELRVHVALHCTEELSLLVKFIGQLDYDELCLLIWQVRADFFHGNLVDMGQKGKSYKITHLGIYLNSSRFLIFPIVFNYIPLSESIMQR